MTFANPRPPAPEPFRSAGFIPVTASYTMRIEQWVKQEPATRYGGGLTYLSRVGSEGELYKLEVYNYATLWEKSHESIGTIDQLAATWTAFKLTGVWS